ncbi:peptidyl-prolyl cis-trans isomerase [bacterium LRH843]|nr:peptidyl-prolyl cis-trans isomerase [bacterium LRH843]
MQEFVFFIDGAVKFPLTVDPTVWIFDERKVDLTTYFDKARTEKDEELEYTKAISAQWDKEITEGSAPPRLHTNENEIKYEKQKLIHGSFGIPLKPFLENTEPFAEADQIEIVQADGESIFIPFNRALSCIVGFSKNGQALKEDGPVHLYFGDGSNRYAPIKQVIRFTVHSST